MTLLERTTTRPSDAATLTGRLRAVLLAALAGLLAAVISWVVVLVPVVVAWLADDRSSTSIWQTAGIGVDLWALAHRGTIEVGATSVVFAPLLLTLVPLLACWYAVGQVVVDRPDARGQLQDVRGWRSAWAALGAAELLAFLGGYVASGLLLVSLASLGQAPVVVASTVPGLVLIPLVAIMLSLWRERRRQEQPTLDRGLRWIELHTPVLFRRGLRPAAQALGLLLTGALLILVALLVMRFDRVLTLYDALDAGTVGTSVLTLGQVLALPNLLVWAMGWTSGADVAVGTVQVGWAGSTAGDLPLVPVLAALPEPGSLPPGLWLVVLIPVLAGAWLGFQSVRAAPRLASWWAKAQIAVSACVCVTVVVLVLSWLALGGLTPGLLAVVGTDPLRVAGLLGAELLGGALLTLTVLHLFRRRL
ncbi:hypothetical protein FNH13_06030 [Ornithinimicrobium ciconiae]|uniref:Uncharacterized protein n=1 Tax=Ornithinimicrobium ciconiae TaxID=2594265 RepID=A0A516G8V4_9MICO|nr:DUF6350 family protein [Ornithinimicrobium ciconiae]QDO87959.1 hypothetical protein FNH13_06030 [Ornithinimicrobium ciconiae]